METETETVGEAKQPIPAVGIGPGDQAYLTVKAKQLLENADVVVGFATVVEYVADLIEGTALSCTYETEAATLNRFADAVASGSDGVVVLMGDPNVSGSQFLETVDGAVDRPIRVIPGISSVQIAASRLRAPLEWSTVVTLHKRGDLAEERDRLLADLGERTLIVLPRPYDWMPEAIAGDLIDRGADPAIEAVILERLTHPDERRTRRSLADLAAAHDRSSESSFSDLSIVVIERSQT